MTARERIIGALDGLGPDEGDVLALVAERLAMGRRAYGELHLATDPRDFRREALEEAADGLVYVAPGLMRVGRHHARGRACACYSSRLRDEEAEPQDPQVLPHRDAQANGQAPCSTFTKKAG